MPYSDYSKRKEYHRRYYKTYNKQEKWVKYFRDYKKRTGPKERFTRKLNIIQHYGGKCVCCGETEPRFLTIDHIHGRKGLNEKEKKMTGGELYKWLKRNNYPKDDYQLLCYNCNCAKGFYGKCPHQETQNN